MTTSRFRGLHIVGARPFHRTALLLLSLVLILGVSPLPALLPTVGKVAPQTVEARRDSARHKQHRKDRARDRSRPATRAEADPDACAFSESGSTWTLQADCTITAPINIPAGVTLDGNNKTITMTGPVLNYRQTVPDNWRVDAGILANGGTGNVRRLTLQGSGLTGTCTPEGIAFINTSGTIENVTVADIRREDGVPCGVGISATGTGGQHVTIRDVTVSGSGTRQIWGLARFQTAGITVDITGATLAVEGVPSAGGDGITYFGPVSGAIADVKVDVQTGQGVGIRAVNNGSPTPHEVSISDVAISGRGAAGIIAGAGAGAPLNVDIDQAVVAWQNIDASAPFGAEAGITYAGDGLTGTVANSSVHNTRFAGISVQDGATVALEDNDVQKGFIGVLAMSGSDVTAGGATIQDVLAGVVASDPATAAAVRDSTITGGKAGPDQAFGILYQLEASGSVDETTVSRFFDTNPNTVSCGIGLASDAGPVAIGHVSYRPPGNEQNLCDPVVFQTLRRGGDASLSAAALAARADALIDTSVELDRPDGRANADGKAKRGHGKHRGRNGKR